MKAPRVDDAALVEMLEVLHESAIEPEGWAPVLRALARHLRADLSTLHSYDHATGGGHCEPGIGIDASQARRYTEHYSAINAWKVRRRNPGRLREVLLGSEVIDDAEFARTEYYNDWVRPLGCFYSIGTVVERAGPGVTTVTLLRSRQAGDFGPEEAELLSRLAPHLQRTIVLRKRLMAAASARTVTLEVLDQLSIGVFLVRSEGRLVHANRMGRRLLAAGDGLRPNGGHLEATDSAAAARLAAEIAACGCTTRLAEIVPRVIAIPRDTEAPLFAAVARLPATLSELADAAVLVSEPRHSNGADDEALLRSLFGLTTAEARLALVIATGSSLSLAAENLGISRETARTHLKRALAKTGARRQAELVRLALAALQAVEPNRSR